jgi:hypothetical protein
MSTEQLIDNNYLCSICNTKNILLLCRNCNKEICSYDSCGMHFEHANNTIYSICNICVNIINKKIVLSVDYDKLRCLKKKIKLLKMVKN